MKEVPFYTRNITPGDMVKLYPVEILPGNILSAPVEKDVRVSLVLSVNYRTQCRNFDSENLEMVVLECTGKISGIFSPFLYVRKIGVSLYLESRLDDSDPREGRKPNEI